MDNHDVCLNIHYTAPEEIWDKIGEVYKSMPYWAGDEKEIKWCGKSIDLWASVEPSGIQIAGIMPGDIWNEWYGNLKDRLSKVVGYEVGEPEDGYATPHYNVSKVKSMRKTDIEI